MGSGGLRVDDSVIAGGTLDARSARPYRLPSGGRLEFHILAGLSMGHVALSETVATRLPEGRDPPNYDRRRVLRSSSGVQASA